MQNVSDPKIMKRILSNPRELVQQQRPVFDSQGNIIESQWDPGGRWLDYLDMLTAYNMEYSKDRIKGFPHAEYERALAFIGREHREQCLQKLRDSLEGTEDLAPLRQFMLAVRGVVDEVEVGVMAHWCQMVKRKLFGMETVWHLMVVFKGAQGGGKSRAVKRMLHPLKEFTIMPNLQEISSESYKPAFSKNYVAFCDELERADRADVSALKNILTTDTFSSRVFYSQRVVTLPQACSFIGATNIPLNEQIYDNTGARRFFQFDTLEKCDKESVNAIDMVALWRGIDVNKNYYNHEAVAARQQHLVQPDPINEFIADLELATDAPERAFISIQDLYALYVHWCEKNGERVRSKIELSKRLQSRGLERTKKNDIRGFLICEFARAKLMGGQNVLPSV